MSTVQVHNFTKQVESKFSCKIVVAIYRETIAPGAIRAFVRWGDAHPNKHDLSSLCLLGTVGEPINPEAFEVARLAADLVDWTVRDSRGSVMARTDE
jgi:hypothetical protein